MFSAVSTRSLSEHVYLQLEHRIVAGDLGPDEPLPSERELCEMLGVNRGAVREAIKRLQQAGLVQVRQGGLSRVLDYESEAGLELLPALLATEEGAMKISVARGMMQMRSSLAPDVARQAAAQPRPELADELQAVVAAMRRASGNIAELQELAFEYWQTMVRGGATIAYKLAFNSLRKAYRPIMRLLTDIMADEFSDTDRLAELAEAVRSGDAERASRLAQQHVDIGRQALERVFDQHETEGRGLME